MRLAASRAKEYDHDRSTAPLGPSPQRAEPIQPDRPGRGDAKLGSPDHSQEKEADVEAKEQSSAAESNVREGYK